MYRRNGIAGLAMAAGLTGAAVLAACSSDSNATGTATATAYGTTVAVGNGTARSYLVTQNGAATELGVELTAQAMEGLPSTPKMGGYEYSLPLPAGNATQYQVIGLNWNPTGHPPPNVYTVPHFDFHFYMVSQDDRNAIDPATDTAFATQAAALPGASYLLPGYVNDPPANAIPHMGLHWTDSNAPEFHGQPFTRTYIIGSWNGRLIFAEPMVTQAYLLTHPSDSVTVASTSQHAISGYYPTAYRVTWIASTSVWHVALSGLTH